MRGFALSTARVCLLPLAGLLLWAAAPARAATLNSSANRSFHYNTSGKVYAAAAPRTVSGPAQLKFDGLSGQTFYPNSGQEMNLGQFSVDSTLPGVATTFNGTPFQVEVRAPEFNKTSTVPVLGSIFSRFGRDLKLKTLTDNSILLRGHLDGTVGADGVPNLHATVDSVRLGGLAPGTSDHVTKYTFPFRFGELKLPHTWTVAASALPRRGVVAAQELATPAPEPATIAIFATALGGFALARHRRRRDS